MCTVFYLLCIQYNAGNIGLVPQLSYSSHLFTLVCHLCWRVRDLPQTSSHLYQAPQCSIISLLSSQYVIISPQNFSGSVLHLHMGHFTPIPIPPPPPKKHFSSDLHWSQEWSWEVEKSLKSDLSRKPTDGRTDANLSEVWHYVQRASNQNLPVNVNSKKLKMFLFILKFLGPPVSMHNGLLCIVFCMYVCLWLDFSRHQKKEYTGLWSQVTSWWVKVSLTLQQCRLCRLML